jgi:hypothetical protein
MGTYVLHEHVFPCQLGPLQPPHRFDTTTTWPAHPGGRLALLRDERVREVAERRGEEQERRAGRAEPLSASPLDRTAVASVLGDQALGFALGALGQRLPFLTGALLLADVLPETDDDSRSTIVPHESRSVKRRTVVQRGESRGTRR